MVKSVVNYRSYPENKTWYPFFGPPYNDILNIYWQLSFLKDHLFTASVTYDVDLHAKMHWDERIAADVNHREIFFIREFPSPFSATPFSQYPNFLTSSLPLPPTPSFHFLFHPSHFLLFPLLSDELIHAVNSSA